jgi:hypothetical protein
MVRPSLRFQILQRDNFTCQYCGASGADVRLEVDHRNPRANGGSNEHTNLVTACWSCNRGKAGGRLPTDVPDLTDAEWDGALGELEHLRDVFRQGDMVGLITEWQEYTGRGWPTRREEIALEKLVIRFGYERVSDAMRVNAVGHGFEDGDPPATGRVDLTQVERLIERWRHEKRARQ